MTTSPATILRDVSLAAVVIALAGAAFGELGGTSAGALAGVVNYLLLWRSATGRSGAAMVGRILGAHVAAFVLLLLLLSVFPAAPVLAGFTAPLLAIGARGLLGVVHPPRPVTPEPPCPEQA